MEQYAAADGDMSTGSLKGHTIIITDPPSVVDDLQIQQQLEAWIAAGYVTRPQNEGRVQHISWSRRDCYLAEG